MSPKSPIPGGWPSSSQLTLNTSNASFPPDAQNGDIAPAEATVGHPDCPPSPLSLHTPTPTLKDAGPERRFSCSMMPANHSCSPADASSSSHVRRAVSFADSIDTAQGHSPPTASPQSNGGEKHDTPTELPAVRSHKPRITDALPTPPPSAMSFSSMAAVSPFIVCTSPRPIPELPSLTQSLSTAASSTAVSFTPSASFAPLSSSPSQSLQIVTDDSQAALFSTEDTALSSPITLNLTEPRSPDSAHFSPAHDIIAFASPASSQFELCDPAVQYEARHPVTFDSHGSPGSISTREPPSGEYEPPSPRSPPGRLGMDGNDFDPTSLYQPPEQRPLLPDADACPPKRSFLHKVRKLGGRIKRLLKGGTHGQRQPTPPHTLATRRNSAASSLLSRRRSPRSFSITLPTPEPVSPTSSRADHDEQTPQTDSDLPPGSPRPVLEPPAPVRTNSVRRPRSRVKLRGSRRFSLPSLFLARQSPSGSAVGTRGSSRADTPSERASPAAAGEPAPQIPETVLAAALPIPGDHVSVRTESQRAVDRVMKDWAVSGELGTRMDAEEVGCGLGIDLAQRSQRIERGRSASGPAMRV